MINYFQTFSVTVGYMHCKFCIIFKDAQNAIPKGTLLAILITSATYIIMALLAGATVLRDASGTSMSEFLMNGTNITDYNSTTLAWTITDGVVTDNPERNLTEQDLQMAPCEIGKCPYGLHNDMNVCVVIYFIALIKKNRSLKMLNAKYQFCNQVMELVSLFGPLILAGIFCATLSSALASLVSAPKVFQVREVQFGYMHKV